LHPIDAYRRVVEVNQVGSFLVASRFADRLIRTDTVGEERGVIINTASLTAFEGQAGHSAYASSKAAVVGMTLPLALDLAPYAIRVMTIAPGAFATPMLLDHLPSTTASFGTQTPHPARLGKPDEFAMLVEAIIINPMLNGEVIRLDGGLRLGPH
jgi:NAD(P)-dependent dehydrogenase (short-subunit alcohol dehydrogenase family)